MCVKNCFISIYWKLEICKRIRYFIGLKLLFQILKTILKQPKVNQEIYLNSNTKK